LIHWWPISCECARAPCVEVRHRREDGHTLEAGGAAVRGAEVVRAEPDPRDRVAHDVVVAVRGGRAVEHDVDEVELVAERLQQARHDRRVVAAGVRGEQRRIGDVHHVRRQARRRVGRRGADEAELRRPHLNEQLDAHGARRADIEVGVSDEAAEHVGRGEPADKRRRGEVDGPHTVACHGVGAHAVVVQRNRRADQRREHNGVGRAARHLDREPNRGGLVDADDGR
jgi:hypothetical protein